MRVFKVSVVSVAVACFVLLSGCVSEQEYKDLQVKNATQEKLIKELQSELQAGKLELDQLKRQLNDARSRGGIEAGTLQEQINALTKALQDKEALIARMQEQLLGGAALPVELSTMLEDFAKGSDMVTYDASRGIVKFKSDLLFDKGSDDVAAEAANAVKALCTIMNSDQGKEFDIIIAGHTDDIPIQKPATREKHPTNWHLSAHRAISVLNVMANDGIDPKRMSIRGFSEFRPVEANKPNKGGNPQNRRVEIYIVPRGT
ncbi:MAG TPA: OmpA family protein [Sedimentisphaerales bacterium]|nr:OmpA family protein [Sedimentisphaerales bacterium]